MHVTYFAKKAIAGKHSKLCSAFLYVFHEKDHVLISVYMYKEEELQGLPVLLPNVAHVQ